MDIAISINEIPVRLTDERWHHITVGHPEMADYYYEILETIENPLTIYVGNSGELIALSDQQPDTNKHIIVVYRENTDENDGFVITAFISNKLNYLNKQEVVWKR